MKVTVSKKLIEETIFDTLVVFSSQRSSKGVKTASISHAPRDILGFLKAETAVTGAKKETIFFRKRSGVKSSQGI